VKNKVNISFFSSVALLSSAPHVSANSAQAAAALKRATRDRDQTDDVGDR